MGIGFCQLSQIYMSMKVIIHIASMLLEIEPIENSVTSLTSLKWFDNEKFFIDQQPNMEALKYYCFKF